MKKRAAGGSVTFQERYGLTDQQMKILRCLGDGLTYKAIAEKLNRSVHTINSHVKELYKKLGVNKASCAVAKSMSEASVFVDADRTTGSKKSP
jgi:DNA-binding NarL/FixJ family response regulator